MVEHPPEFDECVTHIKSQLVFTLAPVQGPRDTTPEPGAADLSWQGQHTVGQAIFVRKKNQLEKKNE